MNNTLLFVRKEILSVNDGSLIYRKCQLGTHNSRMVVRKGLVAFRRGPVTVKKTHGLVKKKKKMTVEFQHSENGDSENGVNAELADHSVSLRPI